MQTPFKQSIFRGPTFRICPGPALFSQRSYIMQSEPPKYKFYYVIWVSIQLDLQKPAHNGSLIRKEKLLLATSWHKCKDNCTEINATVSLHVHSTYKFQTILRSVLCQSLPSSKAYSYLALKSGLLRLCFLYDDINTMFHYWSILIWQH